LIKSHSVFNIITTDIDRNGTSAHGENQTMEPQPPLIHHEHQEEDETPHSTRTSKKDDGQQFLHKLVKTFQRLGKILLDIGHIYCLLCSNFLYLQSPKRGQISTQALESGRKMPICHVPQKSKILTK
jgi:hypothetical protein